MTVGGVKTLEMVPFNLNTNERERPEEAALQKTEK